MFKSLLTFFIFKVPGRRSDYVVLTSFQGQKWLVKCYFEKKKKKNILVWIKLNGFVPATFAQQLHFPMTFKELIIMPNVGRGRMHSGQQMQQNLK